ncbi:MAG: hydroxyethylthiazole kinase [Pseudomonadota bacterium]
MSEKPHHHAPFWVDAAGRCLEEVRGVRPQVHVLTSPVAQVYTANLLLAAGAEPSLSQAPGEIEAFAERTHGLVVNLGMLDAARREAAGRALPILRRRGVPWVLDPVKVERSAERLAYARQLLAEGPRVVRGNAAEMPALGDDLHAEIVHATTGGRDRIVHGKRWVEILNGDPLMTRVTATGCAATTLIAAFLAVEADPFFATGAALLAIAVAGELAAAEAMGPGSFQPAFLDALHRLDRDALHARVRIA